MEAIFWNEVALLGQTSETIGGNHEKDDLKERNTKKIKGGEHKFSKSSFVPKDYSDVVHSREGYDTNVGGLEDEGVKAGVKSFKEIDLGIPSCE